jgi:predicted nucleotidyltransferase
MDAFGLTQDQKISLIQILKSALALHPNTKVYIFGSRAIGKFKKYSDVDLLIESTPDLTQTELGRIKTLLEESQRPYEFDVMTPGRLVEAYQEGVHQTKVLFYAQ